MLDAVLRLAPDARVVRLSQADRLTPYSCIGITRLVAVYPTWWGSVPAVMLDALNDLIGPWVDGEQSRDTSPLRTVASVTVTTSHGSPKRINMLQGEPGLQLWKRTVLPLCAPRATFSWQSLYGLDRIGDAERAAFLDGITLG